MNIPYRTRRLLNRIGIGALIFFIVFAVTWLCWVIWLERYVVYTRDGEAILDLEASSHDFVGEAANPPVGSTNISIYYNDGSDAIETSHELTQMDGYYISMDDLTKNVDRVWGNLELLKAGTPVMIELKGGYGSFYYRSNLPGSVASKSVSADAVEELLKYMKESGFYLIARVSSFRDYDFGLDHVTSGLYMLSRAGLWADEGGCYWLNPTDDTALNWIASIVNELKEKGFHEVVLADFRFPNSDKYIFNGDKNEALVSAAKTLLGRCVDNPSLVLSFMVSDGSFQLPDGRCRIYLENVDAKQVGAQSSKVTMDNAAARLVFVAETNDTRYNDYGVLRPISAADILEAQKAAREAQAAIQAAGTEPTEE